MTSANWPVSGHEWAAQLLSRHIANGEARHAYLFCGAPGVGRRTLALRFAQALNCLQPPAPGLPCGACRTCTQTFAQQLPDLSVVQSLDEDGLPRPGGSIKIEQVRALQHTLSLAPYASRYRVALLLNFQEATTSAQNSLLKTLEEAPEKAILLLTADSPENLLPTILSRCEVLRLRPLSVGRLESELRARGLEEPQARLLAHLSGGRLGYALRLKDDPALLEARGVLLEDWLNLLPAGRAQRFAYAETLTRGERGKDAVRRAFITWLAAWRDVLLAVADPDLPLANPDCEAHIRRLAVDIGPRPSTGRKPRPPVPRSRPCPSGARSTRGEPDLAPFPASCVDPGGLPPVGVPTRARLE